MNGIDVVCLLVLLCGAWRGWRKGFLCGILSLAGWAIGLWLAWTFSHEVGVRLAGYMGEYAEWSRLAAFLLIALGVPLVAHLIGLLLTGFFHLLQLGLLNSLAGALLGTVKYALLLSCLLNLLAVAVEFPSADMRSCSCLYTPLRTLAASAVDWCKMLPLPLQ